MKLWQRATGALKDHNSIWISSISGASPYRNLDLETAIIKATSHDQYKVDYKNAQRVFQWVRTSPHNLKPLAWSLTMRMNKTHSWIVALKGLMLMHGIFYCNVIAVDMIGRLPFDLSNFSDRGSKHGRMWAFNSFVRAYFAFLDQRSALLSNDSDDGSMEQELVKLQKLQSLLDLLIQVKPRTLEMRMARLVLEAMDCIIVEIFDVYSKICKGIARVLVRIYSAGKLEAEMALKIVKKATTQAEEFSEFFDLCKNIGAISSINGPKLSRIPDADIRDLERIINHIFLKTDKNKSLTATPSDGKEKAIVVKDPGTMVEYKDPQKVLKTIITEKWEVFDEEIESSNSKKNVGKSDDPFAELLSLAVPQFPAVCKHEELPDLITF